MPSPSPITPHRYSPSLTTTACHHHTSFSSPPFTPPSTPTPSISAAWNPRSLAAASSAGPHNRKEIELQSGQRHESVNPIRCGG
ncbi:hypothetical protein E2C01_077703 [Portunus trituberculatus]|uniref:Uncharacterized protein n=1 Tax=Portunus trituberculatus TaxID=210409 RepID=A0A5B7IS66_PORTR|nr:hypothetical protein [Portunus trituberculatus]